jgi:hypothetical protein
MRPFWRELYHLMSEIEKLEDLKSSDHRTVTRSRWLLMSVVFALLCLNSWGCFSIIGYEKDLSNLLEGPKLPAFVLFFIRQHFLFFMLSLVLGALSFVILLADSMAKHRRFLRFLIFAMIAQAVVLYTIVFAQLLQVLRTGLER